MWLKESARAQFVSRGHGPHPSLLAEVPFGWQSRGPRPSAQRIQLNADPMITHAQIRAYCMALPNVEEALDRFGFNVPVKGKPKGLCWTWLERVDPRRARVLNPSVMAVRVPNLTAKELILESYGDAVFTEAHYNGYPAVLVWLDRIDPELMYELLEGAWRCMATKSDLEVFDVRP